MLVISQQPALQNADCTATSIAAAAASPRTLVAAAGADGAGGWRGDVEGVDVLFGAADCTLDSTACVIF